MSDNLSSFDRRFPFQTYPLKPIEVAAAERAVIEAAEALVDADGFHPETNVEAEQMWRIQDAVAKLQEVRGK
jgi:hypothetical protein